MSAIVRASYPVSFQLLNRDRQPILGIFDGQQGQTLKLEITNSSRRNVKPKPLTGNATADNHHFELRFRPGTLVLPDIASPNRPAISVEEPGWKISEKPTVSDAGVSFYLLIINPTTIESGKSTSVTLNNLSGDGKVGAHGTRVELKWNNSLEYLASASGQSPEPLVRGYRLQHLSVVNQSGQKQIPLHVGIVGNDKVLNNGNENELTVRITSLLKKDEGNIVLNEETADRTKPPGTKFILSFDASPPSATSPPKMNSWALGFIDEVNKIGIKAEDKPFNTPSPSEQGQSVQWIMWPTRSITLQPGDYIDLKIKPIKTTHPSGLTNLYIKYKNIPGYWDGNFVALIEKAPLVYKEQLVNEKREQRIGVGTADPQADLHVNGKLRVEKDVSVGGTGVFAVDAPDDPGGRLLIDTESKVTVKKLRVEKDVSVGGGAVFAVDAPNAPAGRLKIDTGGNVGIGASEPKSRLHVNGDVRVEKNKEIYFVDNGQIRSFDDKHRILFRRETYNVMELREVGHIVFSAGASAGNETAKMVIKDTGDVGIGTSNPAKTLHVNGGLRVENEVSVGGGFDFEVDAPGVHGGRFKVKQDGKVGIGTHDPTKAKLEISGSVGGTIGTFAFLNSAGVKTGGSSSPNDYSIWVSNRMAASEFNAFSDERIKNIQGRSDGATDLSTLLGIEITDYSFKDVIGKGGGTYKKVIGQQVGKVFPQAISRQTDVVPDIYQLAPIHDGWVVLATDLKKGERVKLITEKGEDLHEVLEVTNDKFLVDFKYEGDKVFVFGREVTDFLTVDYDAISMLNVSATQQLKKDMDQELKALRVENAELRSANDALARRLQLLERKLEAVAGVMAAANGSNGNGRH